jgi:hypothetical protein
MKDSVKNYLILRWMLACVLVLSLLGCSTAFKKTVDPATGVQTVQVSDTTSNTLAKIGAVINAVPAEVPYSETAKTIALGLLSLTTLGFGLVAKAKTALAGKQTQAADVLAATVVKANAQQSALAVASGTPALQTVAQHIDNNTV